MNLKFSIIKKNINEILNRPEYLLKISHIKEGICAFILPLLVAIFPVLFLYSQNITKLSFPTFGRLLTFFSLIAITFYLISCFLSKGNVLTAANASFVFLIFFNTYGLFFKYLVKQDWFRVEHYTLLPFFLLVSLYASWMVAKVNPKKMWRVSLLFVSLAVVINLIKIVPTELGKMQKAQININNNYVNSMDANEEYPDIYYIIFDEFAGFDTMRSYWNYQEVDNFIEFAKRKGFYVALESNSSSLATFHQLAERLNYTTYPLVDSDDISTYFSDIIDNKVMQYLRNKGYKTIVFEETEHFFGGFTKMKADFSFEYDSSKMSNLGILFDDFGILVSDNTMLLAFSNFYKIIDPTLSAHREWINFTAEKLADLSEIPSPKIVYVHLILPHYPFMFDENGNTVDPKFYYNWNYYLGNYKYSISIAEKIINNLISDKSQHNQPVVVIQSDHGARNILTSVTGSQTLPNFPEEYKYNIMNIMYMPGFDYSELSQDINPINTFPIIFNFYFNEKIPLQ